jgi:hypothetical protein
VARLTSKQRKALPASAFALGKGRYPIEDKNHARAALTDVSRVGTPAQKASVRGAVKRKYPAMGGGSLSERLLRGK